ncbi:MAG TPA: pyridoxal-phosphate dependent enzyme [Bacteroidales bacterium]|nr:pyridoxal-phosphate dependent enzyme [Bacteroidales bacterium]HRZ77443.1 pyridoxal-phosphate dependent enzyme [Bacteroidales bacterium]
MDHLPLKDDILEAHLRIRPWINHTPVFTSAYLNALSGSELFFKCENLQKVGAFKSRGAVNAVFSLQEEALAGVCTHSSGNHAQALARAAALRGIPAYIVMPDNAPRVKVDAVKSYGGRITFCEPTLQARESTLLEVSKKTGAIEIHPYNDYRVITGQATAAMELLEQVPGLQIIMPPVGGGGLLSGTALSNRYFNPGGRTLAAEPEGADDAFRSLQAGHIIPSIGPRTIADGLLTSLGSRTFPIIRDHVERILTVSEANILKSMRLIWERMKLVIEPSAALPLGAVLQYPEIFQGVRTGLILSGGNVDLDRFSWSKP